jgi:hypothetical protein
MHSLGVEIKRHKRRRIDTDHYKTAQLLLPPIRRMAKAQARSIAGDRWFRAPLGATYRKSSSGQNGWHSFVREALFNLGAFLREITLDFLLTAPATRQCLAS